MDIKVEALISEIYARPELWDKKNKLYHNRIIVAKSWKSIAAELQAPRDQLKKKWKIIRDQFRNECKKLPTPKPGEEGIVPDYDYYISWPHFTSLLFLKDHMKARKPCGNDSEESIPPSDDANALNRKTAFRAPYKRPVEIGGWPSALAAPKKKRDVAYQGVESASTTKSADDPCRMFLLSLLPDVQRLSEVALRQFKIKTMVLLDDMLTKKDDELIAQPTALPTSAAPATYALSPSYEPMSPMGDGTTPMKIETEYPAFQEITEGIV